eukprot:EG_transcript_18331
MPEVEGPGPTLPSCGQDAPAVPSTRPGSLPQPCDASFHSFPAGITGRRVSLPLSPTDGTRWGFTQQWAMPAISRCLSSSSVLGRVGVLWTSLSCTHFLSTPLQTFERIWVFLRGTHEVIWLDSFLCFGWPPIASRA